MVRKLALAMVCMAMTAFRGAFALGLGEIELHSALNEPLSANIKLLSARPGEMDQAVVRLAPRKAFARLGVDRLDVLSRLKFSVETSPSGKTFLHVSTAKAIDDPFLTFVVEVVWPRGRLMREYTLLLDLPVFTPEAPAPISAPVVRQAAQPVAAQIPAPVVPPPAATEISAPGAAAQSTAAAAAGEYGPTRRDETLWEIAKRLRPDASVSVNQVMQALLRANSKAFFRDNINNLKAGYVLRVPSKDEMLSMTVAEALAETRRHARLWRKYRGHMSEMPIRAKPAGQAKPGQPEQEGEHQTAATGQLEIVAPEKMVKSGTGATGEAATATRGDAGLRKEVQLLTEASEAQSQENTELRTRIKEMEKQLETLARLVTLRSQEMLKLQKKSIQPPVEPKLAPAPTKPEGLVAWIDKVLANPMTLLLAIVVVLLLVLIVWLIIRRRRMGMSHFQESILTTRQPEGPPASGAAGAIAEGAEAVTGTEDDVVEAEEAESAISTFSDFPMSGMGDIHSEVSEVDPLSEADVYIAYGRYQQAEELIKEALIAEPGRHDLRLKLLEVYHANKDIEAFEDQASALHDEINNPAAPMWLKVIQMGHELNPENALFRGQATDEATVENITKEEETLDIGAGLADLDLSSLDLAGEAGSGAAASAEAATDAAGDLDLGAEAPTRQEAEGEGLGLGDLGGDASDLDFDLSDFDLGGSASEDLADLGTSEELPDLGDLDLSDRSEDLPDLGDFDLEGVSPGDASAEEAGFDLLAATDVDTDEAATDTDELTGELDEVGTKLDLARAYIDMGDSEGARSILDEVLEEGSDQYQAEAQKLLDQMN